MTSDLLGRVSGRIRLLALLVVAVLLGAAFVSANQHSTRPTRQLGIRGLQLAAFDGSTKIYLRLPGISGAASRAHTNDLDLTSMSWGISQAVDSTSGLPSGRHLVTDFSVKKSLDKYSPALLGATGENQVFKTATIDVVHAATSEELDYTLTNADLISDHQSASSSGGAETLQLAFQKLVLSYLSNGKVVSTATYSTAPPV